MEADPINRRMGSITLKQNTMKTKHFYSVLWFAFLCLLFICLKIMYQQSIEIKQEQAKSANWETLYKLSDK